MFNLKLMMLASFLLAVTALAGLGAGPEGNAVIWKKEFEKAGTLVVERAYVYGPAFNYYQYAFIQETVNGDNNIRRLLWVRKGYPSSISGKIPEPQIQMLDACLSDGTLCVVFNQYEKCWAFVVETQDPDGLGSIQPTHKDVNGLMNWASGAISVGLTAKSAKILKAEGLGKTRLRITRADDSEAEFRLLKTDGTAWHWRPEMPSK